MYTYLCRSFRLLFIFIALFSSAKSHAQPSFISCNDTIIGVSSSCQLQSLQLQNIAEPSLICEDNTISWQVLLDIWGDNSYDFEFLSDLPLDHIEGTDTNDNGIADYNMSVDDNRIATIDAVFNIGASHNHHKVLWRASDACGNVSACQTIFLVVDKTAPSLTTPKYKYIDNNPFEDGFEAVPAKALVALAEDNCTSSEDLIYTFGGLPVDRNRDHYFRTRENGDVNLIQYDSLPMPAAFFNNDNVQYWSASKQTSFISFSYCFKKLNVTVYDQYDNYSMSDEIFVLAFHDANNCDEVYTRYLTKIVSEYSSEAIQYVNFDRDSTAFYNSFFQEDSYSFGFLPYYFSDKKLIERNDQYNNGLSTRDILLLEKEINTTSNNYSKADSLSLDLDLNGVIEQYDASYLQQLVLRNKEYLQDNRDWRFYQTKTNTTSDEDCTVFIEDDKFYVEPCTEFDIGRFDLGSFYAVKGGDLSQNASHNENHRPQEPYADQDLTIIVDNIKVNPSQDFECSFYVEDRRDFHGLQLMLITDAFSITDIKSDLFDLNLETNINTVNDTTYITMHSLDRLDISSFTELFTIRAEASKEGNVIDFITLGEDLKYMRSEGYVYDSFTPTRLVLDEIAPYLNQNYPNPFTSNTQIEFFIRNAEETIFSIYAADGKLVYRKESGFKRGINHININRDLIYTSGVYFYQLHSRDFIQSKKMVFLE